MLCLIIRSCSRGEHLGIALAEIIRINLSTASAYVGRRIRRGRGLASAKLKPATLDKCVD